MLLEFKLYADRRAPGRARRTLRSISPEIPEQSDLVELLVTEIVTNAVLHAGITEEEPVSLALRVTPNLVRVEVTDSGPGFDRKDVHAPPLLATGQRGLLLLDELSDRWGVERNNGTNVVWFELDRPAHSRTA